MHCPHCQTELIATANFCSRCGQQLPKGAGLRVHQQAGSVTGTMTGLVASERALPPDAPATVEQKIDTVAGVVTGIALGGAGGPLYLVGQQHHIDQHGQTVHGPQTNIAGGVDTGGGDFTGGAVTPGATSPAPDLLRALPNLLAAVAQAGAAGLLNAEQVIDLETALRKALNQAVQTQPNIDLLLGHLTTAHALVSAAAPAHSLATTLTHLLAILRARASAAYGEKDR